SLIRLVYRFSVLRKQQTESESAPAAERVTHAMCNDRNAKREIATIPSAHDHCPTQSTWCVLVSRGKLESYSSGEGPPEETSICGVVLQPGRARCRPEWSLAGSDPSSNRPNNLLSPYRRFQVNRTPRSSPTTGYRCLVTPVSRYRVDLHNALRARSHILLHISDILLKSVPYDVR